jgi:hypothetical protein
MVAVVEDVKLLAPLGLRETSGRVEGLLASSGSEASASSRDIGRFSSEGKACSACESDAKIEACLSVKRSTGCCRTIESRLNLSRRERAFERLRRSRAIAIEMVMRTSDPMTAPMTIPVVPFLPATAPTAVGLSCSPLPLVGLLRMTLMLLNRIPQKGKYTSNRGTYEGARPSLVPSVPLALFKLQVRTYLLM